MMDRLRIAALTWAGAAAGGLALAPALLAQVPPAMDRVPTGAYIIAAIPNLQQFHGSIDALAGRIGLPPETLQQMAAARQILQTPGLDPAGSASIAVMEVENGGDNFIAVLPVRDYQAFVTSLGGAVEGVSEIELHDRTFFVRDIGDGFAAAAPQRGLVEGFEGRAGNAAAHREVLGETGRAIAGTAGVFIVANMPALAPRLRKGLEQGVAQAQMMGAMMGGGMPDLQHAQEIAEAFLRDATATIIGIRALEQGATLELGTQFRADSELAGYFDARGDASQLINALPDMPFLMTFALDARSPNLRRALQQLVPTPADPEAQQQFQALNPLQALELADGFSFMWGTTPALMGGIFLNTVAYTRASDPDAYLNWVRDGLGAMHEQKIEGITYQTSLKEQEVGERKAHTWSIRMKADQRHPGAQQAMQVQMWLFGAAGLNGYLAKAREGVVMTYSRTTGLLEQAISAAETDSGLRSEAGIRAVSEHLPPGRTFEGYLGIRNILETALGVMGMMGAAPMNFELPEVMPPIGMGGTTVGGGLRMSIFVPAEVLATAQQLQDAFGDDDWDEDWDEEDEEPTGLPRF